MRPEHTKFAFLLLLGATIFISSCNDDESCTETTWYEDADGDGFGNPDESQLACDQPSGYVSDNTDTDDDLDDNGSSSGGVSTPIAAFDDFNPDAITISFDGDDITIESNGLPNHTSPYWGSTDPLYIEPVVAGHLTPGGITSRSLTVTVSAAPTFASSSTATGLGAIGISVTGVPIFNDQEGDNRSIEEEIVDSFDYAGAHNGPSGYHYHIESSDVPENTVLSYDDEKLVGIMADGFLLYGRKCNSIADHPTDLDVSGGHYSLTQHTDDEEFYHYHIINEYYLGTVIALFAVDLQGTPNTIL